ncbi:Uncharacterised protein [uncultured archaeon]|nr:Uncharacterised protein [uncultured archaeon]
MKNKKGLSVVIGYVLLIVISIVMSVIVYQWLRTYIPKEAVQCSDGTSLFIREISYNCTGQLLNITVKNNGKFSIDGYYIHVSNRTGENLSAIDLSHDVIYGGNFTSNSVIFSLFQDNILTPDQPRDVRLTSFNVSKYGQLYRVEIIPMRIEEIDNKNRTVVCSNAKVSSDLVCS